MIYKPSIYTSLLRKTTTHHLGISVNTIKQNVKAKFKRAPAYLLSHYFNFRGSFGGKNRLTTYYQFFKCIFLPHPPSYSFHAGVQNVSSIKEERPKLQTYIFFSRSDSLTIIFSSVSCHRVYSSQLITDTSTCKFTTVATPLVNVKSWGLFPLGTFNFSLHFPKYWLVFSFPSNEGSWLLVIHKTHNSDYPTFLCSARPRVVGGCLVSACLVTDTWQEQCVFPAS